MAINPTISGLLNGHKHKKIEVGFETKKVSGYSQIMFGLAPIGPRSCKRREILFQKSLLLFLTWREYFYSQPKK